MVALASYWIGKDWINQQGQAGPNGWSLNPGDQFFVADLDGDNQDELVLVSASGQWVGIAEQQGGGLVLSWLGNANIDPAVAGGNTWNLSAGDQFFVADLDG